MDLIQDTSLWCYKEQWWSQFTWTRLIFMSWNEISTGSYIPLISTTDFRSGIPGIFALDKDPVIVEDPTYGVTRRYIRRRLTTGMSPYWKSSHQHEVLGCLAATCGRLSGGQIWWVSAIFMYLSKLSILFKGILTDFIKRAFSKKKIKILFFCVYL